MADMKIPPAGRLPARVDPPARPASPARTEAIRAAQRAFFQAAAGETPPAEPARTAPAGRAANAQPSPEPARYARPGSRVDIKV